MLPDVISPRQERLLAWVIPWNAVMLAAGILLGRMAETALYGWLMLACSVVVLWLCRDKAKFFALGLTVLALGSVLGQAAYHPQMPSEGEYEVSGIVAGEIRHGDYGQVKMELRHVTLNGEKAGNAYWSFYLADGETLSEQLVPGMKVAMTAEVYHPDGADNPDGYDFREYLLQRGMTFGVYGRDDLVVSDAPFTLDGWAAGIRHRLSRGLIAAMGEEAGGYASAMLLGVTALVPSEDRAAFSKLGIAHILSISGFHVGVLAALVSGLMCMLYVPRAGRLVISGIVLAAYCVLTGANAPVVRAAILYMLNEWGMVWKKQRSGLHLLCTSFIVMLLAQPCQLTSASFQLTYGAMLGLTLVTPALRYAWRPKAKNVRKLWTMASATVGAQLGVLLPQLYWFGELPLLALVLNLFVFVLTSGVMALYWITLALLPLPVLAQVSGTASAWITSLLMQAVRWLGSFDFVSLWLKQAGWLTAIGWLLVMIASSHLAVLHGRKRRMAGIVGAVLLIVSLIPLPHLTTEYIQFSVGNADAALLHDNGEVVLIDTGDDGFEVSRYLYHRRLSVDTLILTHLHMDHAGGVAALVEDGIPVKRCCIPVRGREMDIDEKILRVLSQLESTGTEIIEVSRGDVIGLPSGSMTVLWPEEERIEAGRDANEYSLALQAEINGTTMLLSGDLDGVYKRYAAVEADILKAAHHGSTGSMDAAFLQAVDPSAVLLSTSGEERLQRMQEKAGDADVYSTRQHGALTICFEENGYTITTFK